MKVKRTVGMFCRRTGELMLGETEIVISEDDGKITIPYSEMSEVSMNCPPGRASRLEFTALNEGYEFIIENNDDVKALAEGLKRHLCVAMRVDFIQ